MGAYRESLRDIPNGKGTKPAGYRHLPVRAAVLIALCQGQPLMADDFPAAMTQSGTLKPVQSEDVRMRDESIAIEATGREYAVEVEYTFVNEGRAQTVFMAFPNFEDPTAVIPIQDFRAFDGEKPLHVFTIEGDSGPLTLGRELEWGREFDTGPAPDGIGPRRRYECFRTTFAKGETKRIRNTYSQHMLFDYDHDMTHYHVYYVLRTGALWKGPIGSVRVSIELPKGALSRNLLVARAEHYCSDWVPFFGWCVLDSLAVSPGGYAVDGDRITMAFADLEPDFDISIRYPCALVRGAHASTTLRHAENRYAAENVIDADPATAWAEGAEGPGVGESVTVELANPCLIDSLSIRSGYCRDSVVFRNNARPRKIKLVFLGPRRNRCGVVEREPFPAAPPRNKFVFPERYDCGGDSGAVAQYDLADTMARQGLRLRRPMLAGEITVGILDVYEGDKYEDACISELTVHTTKVTQRP